MSRARVFKKKIYCSNCGKHILSIKTESKEKAAFHKLEATFNHEICGTPGSGTKTFAYNDLNARNLEEIERKRQLQERAAIAMMQNTTISAPK